MMAFILGLVIGVILGFFLGAMVEVTDDDFVKEPDPADILRDHSIAQSPISRIRTGRMEVPVPPTRTQKPSNE